MHKEKDKERCTKKNIKREREMHKEREWIRKKREIEREKEGRTRGMRAGRVRGEGGRMTEMDRLIDR